MSTLGYEEMLSELQGLLGKRVCVSIARPREDGVRAFAYIFGELVLARAGDLSALTPGADVPGGETVAFRLGPGLRGALLLRADDYQGGEATNGKLGFGIGDLTIGVWPYDGVLDWSEDDDEPGA